MRCAISCLIFVVSLLVLGRVSLAAKDQSMEAAQFWNADTVHTIHIRITAQQWKISQPLPNRLGRDYVVASSVPRPSAPSSTRPALVLAPPSTQPVVHHEGDRLAPNFYGFEFAYVKATFECDGVTLKDVGFRQRGNSSFNWGAGGLKRPYKLSFGEFVSGQKFHDLSGFYLNNIAYDPSLLRETLAYETYRSLGVPAPRTTLALVYLTIDGRAERDLLGLYTLVEKIDSKPFLKSHFGSAKGMLMKPWSIRGLPYMGQEWKAYESHYNARTSATPAGARRTIDFIKLVNYADDDTFRRQIADYLNVEEFLGLVAVYVTTSNLDNILYTGHNFYLYLNPKDNRFHFMPWDMNLSYASFTSAASIEQQVHLSIMRPHTGEAKLIDRLLAMPQYNQAYRQHIQRLLQTCCNPEKFAARVDSLQTVIAKADQAADEAWKARFVKTSSATTRPANIPPRPVVQLMGWAGQPAIPLKTFMTRRAESIKAQLAGQTDGYSPGYHAPPALPAGGLHANPAYGNLPLIAVILTRIADSDYDSKLTSAEYTAAVRNFFTQAVAGQNSSLDQVQLAKAVLHMLQQVPVSPRKAERAGLKGPMPPADAAPLWAKAIFNAIDTEKTGRLTLPQLLSAAEAAFTRGDKDKSGKLDETELLALLDSLAAATPPPAPSTRPAGK